jgi:hypothetical protein
MTYVWLVEVGEYDDRYLVGVFSTEKGAKEHEQRLIELNDKVKRRKIPELKDGKLPSWVTLNIHIIKEELDVPEAEEETVNA